MFSKVLERTSSTCNTRY